MAKLIDITEKLDKAREYYLTLRNEKCGYQGCGYIHSSSKLREQIAAFSAKTGCEQVTAQLGEGPMKPDTHGYTIFNVSITIKKLMVEADV